MKKRNIVVTGLFVFVLAGAGGGFYWAKTHGKLNASADYVGASPALCASLHETYHNLGSNSYCDYSDPHTPTTAPTVAHTTTPTPTPSATATHANTSSGGSSSNSSSSSSIPISNVPATIGPMLSIEATATPASVSAGGSSTLVWSAINASSATCGGSGTAGFSNAISGTGGTVLISNIKSSLALTISCIGGGVAQKTINITVSNPSTVQTPVCTTLPSALQGLTTLFGSQVQSNCQSTTSSAVATFAIQSTTVAPVATTAPSNSTAATTSAPTVSLTANGGTSTVKVASTATVTLAWSSSNATSCTRLANWNGTSSSSDLSGSMSVGPFSQDTTITLSCSGTGGTTQKSVAISIIAPVTTTPTATVTYKTSGTYISAALNPASGLNFTGTIQPVGQVVPTSTSIEYQIGHADSTGNVSTWISLGAASNGVSADRCGSYRCYSSTTTSFALPKANSTDTTIKTGPVKVKIILTSDGKSTPLISGFQLLEATVSTPAGTVTAVPATTSSPVATAATTVTPTTVTTPTASATTAAGSNSVSTATTTTPIASTAPVAPLPGTITGTAATSTSSSSSTSPSQTSNSSASTSNTSTSTTNSTTTAAGGTISSLSGLTGSSIVTTVTSAPKPISQPTTLWQKIIYSASQAAKSTSGGFNSFLSSLRSFLP